MTKDDDRLNTQNDEPGVNAAAEKAAGGSERLPDIAGGGIGTGEVRVVAIPPEPSSNNALLVVLLLLIVLIGAGYFLLSSGLLNGGINGQAVVEPQRHPIPDRPLPDSQIEEEVVRDTAVAAVSVPKQPAVEKPAAPPVQVTAKQMPAQAPAKAVVDPLYQVLIGPFLNSTATQKADAICAELGLNAKQTRGEGLVGMVRLLEGIYPKAEARERLNDLKKQVKSAFLLPAGDKLAVYGGSFYELERAQRETEALARKNIRVSPLATRIKMEGDILIAVQADKQTADHIAKLIEDKGLPVQVVRQK